MRLKLPLALLLCLIVLPWTSFASHQCNQQDPVARQVCVQCSHQPPNQQQQCISQEQRRLQAEANRRQQEAQRQQQLQQQQALKQQQEQQARQRAQEQARQAEAQRQQLAAQKQAEAQRQRQQEVQRQQAEAKRKLAEQQRPVATTTPATPQAPKRAAACPSGQVALAGGGCSTPQQIPSNSNVGNSTAGTVGSASTRSGLVDSSSGRMVTSPLQTQTANSTPPTIGGVGAVSTGAISQQAPQAPTQSAPAAASSTATVGSIASRSQLLTDPASRNLTVPSQFNMAGTTPQTAIPTSSPSPITTAATQPVGTRSKSSAPNASIPTVWSKADPNKSYQCTDYAELVRPDLKKAGVGGDANRWLDNAASKGFNTAKGTTAEPKPGAVIVLHYPGSLENYGHVGVVKGIETDSNGKRVVVFESANLNTPTKKANLAEGTPPQESRIVVGDARIDGYIYEKSATPSR